MPQDQRPSWLMVTVISHHADTDSLAQGWQSAHCGRSSEYMSAGCCSKCQHLFGFTHLNVFLGLVGRGCVLPHFWDLAAPGLGLGCTRDVAAMEVVPLAAPPSRCHGIRACCSGLTLSETVTQALASFFLFPSFTFYLTEPFKHLLSACCVPGTALGTGNRTEHKGESC